MDNPELGTVFIPGMGDARVFVWAIIPQDNSSETEQTQSAAYDRWFLMGVDDPLTVTNPPNPLEIVVEVAKASSTPGGNYEGGIKFSSSTMVGY